MLNYENSVIIIRGPLGVGKTTISRILAERMNVKLYLIDDLLIISYLIKFINF